MEFTVGQIAGLINGKVVGDESLIIKKLGKIEEGEAESIAFLSNLKYEPFLYNTNATAVIIDKNLVLKKDVNSALILVEDPYAAFSSLLEKYAEIFNFSKHGIEQPSYIGKNSKTGEGLYLGAFSYIGNNCTIGKNVKIFPQAYVGDNVCIGDNTIIYSGAKIYAGCIIGNYCTIHSGSVIGSDGFGFAPLPDGSYKTIPQVGNVILENNISIGANTVIDCATMGSTIIKEGVKLDNLIQIAHNVEIGKHTVIAAQSGVSGSTKIGDNCVFAGQVGIVGHINIASGTKIGAQSGISKSISEKGLSLQGSPAFDYKEQLRSLVVFRRLPKLESRLEMLENKINNITE